MGGELVKALEESMKKEKRTTVFAVSFDVLCYGLEVSVCLFLGLI